MFNRQGRNNNRARADAYILAAAQLKRANTPARTPSGRFATPVATRAVLAESAPQPTRNPPPPGSSPNLHPVPRPPLAMTRQQAFNAALGSPSSSSHGSWDDDFPHIAHTVEDADAGAYLVQREDFPPSPYRSPTTRSDVVIPLTLDSSSSSANDYSMDEPPTTRPRTTVAEMPWEGIDPIRALVDMYLPRDRGGDVTIPLTLDSSLSSRGSSVVEVPDTYRRGPAPDTSRAPWDDIPRPRLSPYRPVGRWGEVDIPLSLGSSRASSASGGRATPSPARKNSPYPIVLDDDSYAYEVLSPNPASQMTDSQVASPVFDVQPSSRSKQSSALSNEQVIQEAQDVLEAVLRETQAEPEYDSPISASESLSAYENTREKIRDAIVNGAKYPSRAVMLSEADVEIPDWHIFKFAMGNETGGALDDIPEDVLAVVIYLADEGRTREPEAKFSAALGNLVQIFGVASNESSWRIPASAVVLLLAKRDSANLTGDGRSSRSQDNLVKEIADGNLANLSEFTSRVARKLLGTNATQSLVDVFEKIPPAYASPGEYKRRIIRNADISDVAKVSLLDVEFGNTFIDTLDASIEKSVSVIEDVHNLEVKMDDLITSDDPKKTRKFGKKFVTVKNIQDVLDDFNKNAGQYWSTAIKNVRDLQRTFERFSSWKNIYVLLEKGDKIMHSAYDAGKGGKGKWDTIVNNFTEAHELHDAIFENKTWRENAIFVTYVTKALEWHNARDLSQLALTIDLLESALRERSDTQLDSSEKIIAHLAGAAADDAQKLGLEVDIPTLKRAADLLAISRNYVPWREQKKVVDALDFSSDANSVAAAAVAMIGEHESMRKVLEEYATKINLASIAENILRDGETSLWKCVLLLVVPYLQGTCKGLDLLLGHIGVPVAGEENTNPFVRVCLYCPGKRPDLYAYIKLGDVFPDGAPSAMADVVSDSDIAELYVTIARTIAQKSDDAMTPLIPRGGQSYQNFVVRMRKDVIRVFDMFVLEDVAVREAAFEKSQIITPGDIFENADAVKAKTYRDFVAALEQ